MDDLFYNENYEEEDILNERGKVPRIQYLFDGKVRFYTCDIYIPKKKLIIEVKSSYTFTLNKEKIIVQAKECMAKGYNYELRIYTQKGKYVIYDIEKAYFYTKSGGMRIIVKKE